VIARGDWLDLTGPQFLLLYVGLMVAALLLGLVLRRSLATPHDGAGGAAAKLDALQLACLRGGAAGALQAALAVLHSLHLVRVQRGKFLRESIPGGGTKLFPSRLIGEVHGALPTAAPITFAQLQRSLPRELAAFAAPLRDRGLLVEVSQGRLAQALAAAPMLALVVFGALKVAIGVERERPVCFLLVLLAVSLVAAIGLALPLHASGRGRAVLRAELQRHRPLFTAATRDAGRLEAADLTLAVGLFGPQFLAQSELGQALGVKSASDRDHHHGHGTGCGGGGGTQHDSGSSDGGGAGSGCGGGGGGGGCGGCGGG
jgi:uncharacterized protein (TIGR04222 family)